MNIIDLNIKKENIKTDNLSKEQLGVFNNADTIKKDNGYLYGYKNDTTIFCELYSEYGKFLKFHNPNFIYKKVNKNNKHKEHNLNNDYKLLSSKKGKELKEDIKACNKIIERDKMKKTKLKTIELHENTTSIFTGSQELRRFIINYCHCDFENKTRMEYHIDYLSDEDLKSCRGIKDIKSELDLLISELNDRNLTYLSILKE